MRSIESHNQPHKYLDLNINLSELRQILCKTEFPPHNAIHKERCVEFSNAIHKERCVEFSNAIHKERCVEFSNAIHRERCVEFSNAIHKERCVEFSLFLGGVSAPIEARH